jgi:hypothetical protein
VLRGAERVVLSAPNPAAPQGGKALATVPPIDLQRAKLAIDTADSASQLDDVAKRIAAAWDELGERTAGKLWKRIDVRRKHIRERASQPQLFQSRSEATAATVPTIWPCRNFYKDQAQLHEQLTADRALSPRAREFGNYCVSRCLHADPRSPSYLTTWKARTTFQAALKWRAADVIAAREELEARGHIKVERRRGKGKTTIIRFLFKPALANNPELPVSNPAVSQAESRPAPAIIDDPGRKHSVDVGVLTARRAPAALDEAETARRERLNLTQFHAYLEANGARGHGHTFEYGHARITRLPPRVALRCRLMVRSRRRLRRRTIGISDVRHARSAHQSSPSFLRSEGRGGLSARLADCDRQWNAS